MASKFLLLFSIVCLVSVGLTQVPQNFILIKGGTFQAGKNQVRVEDFEMLDHPITNQEYEAFVKATGYQAPFHWTNGVIPPGKADFPVIYVNREDVKVYLKWLSQKDNRIYRLPTTVEFEYAARAGKYATKYIWDDKLPDQQINYDAKHNRPFDRWEDFLKPAKWGYKNALGLYGMVGNVWNMTTNNADPATQRYKYRIEDEELLEGSIMGGSWARSLEYLPAGFQLGVSSGIRHPDIGFRPVREPAGADWKIVPRKLCTVSAGDGKIFLSWALLATDKSVSGFNIYRATARNHAGFKINNQPVINSTNYLDTNLSTGRRYHYYIRPVDKNDKEGHRSEWAGIDATEKASPVIMSFEPFYRQGALVPVFGDLNGDGTLDCVIRMDNGNSEMSQDPGIPVQLEAFVSYGRSLWRKDLCYHDHCYGSANNVPFNVWDMDGDGNAEIITRLQIGDSVFVAILEGMTGRLRAKTPWPDMASDFQKSSTRIHLSIAYLDGKHPAVVTQTGLYENEVFVAYDAQLKQIWRFDSFGPTNGSGGHKIEVADVNSDGKQEVFNGTTCLNHDGTLRWSIYKLHPDIVSIHDYLPERPGLEVFYIVETSVHAGVYMVDANSGEIIWKQNREDDPAWTHGHSGWTADIWDGSPGIEAISNRAGHDDHHYLLFSANGKVLRNPFPAGYTPIEWDGDLTRELLSANGTKIGNFNGREIIDVPELQPNPLPKASLSMVADLYGDFRDELVLITTLDSGKRGVTVVTATEPITKKYVTATAVLDYRLWLGRNMGGGYRSVYDRELRE
ncbi:SUMF1/EgtB/PvdO family nonheme iron enzyme [candidate division KSB1 bacterium]|nr:SUMF1/EgtB/PvdO family nonheme iron enzyme [candidate division KSB1 bacterium]